MIFERSICGRKGADEYLVHHYGATLTEIMSGESKKHYNKRIISNYTYMEHIRIDRAIWCCWDKEGP